VRAWFFPLAGTGRWIDERLCVPTGVYGTSIAVPTAAVYRQGSGRLILAAIESDNGSWDIQFPFPVELPGESLIIWLFDWGRGFAPWRNAFKHGWLQWL
jgi:hypothetical protein